MKNLGTTRSCAQKAAWLRGKALLLLQLCFLSVGCTQRVDYVVKNNSTNAVREVTVTIGPTHVRRHGILGVDMHTSFAGSMKLKSTNTVTISWAIENGKEFERILVLSDNALRDERSPVFTINKAMQIEQSWRWDD